MNQLFTFNDVGNHLGNISSHELSGNDNSGELSVSHTVGYDRDLISGDAESSTLLPASPDLTLRAPTSAQGLGTANDRLKSDLSSFPKCFKAAHFNAQSLNLHLPEIRTITDGVDFHAILISESTLKYAICRTHAIFL
uniref:Uncharacterized protein n=1 Tax=Cacopsylla melanoneura TaxID=428564 RepID=A0A8D8TL75_9HEMI